MSDLTRHTIKAVALSHPDSGWVRAEEAEARIKKLESGAIDQALPDAPIDENTEIVWVNGRAFINQAKHEQVVDRHVARIAELEAECAAWKIADESWVRRVNEQEARLRAADELADAVKNFGSAARREVGAVSPAERAMYQAALAYREASK